MTGTIVLLDLAGWVALLLWGIHMIRTGVQRAYGADLQQVLGASLGHPLKALLAGLGVTLVLQSSTATGLMATSFAAGGLVELGPALAVMLGANVGTALIVKALSFDVAKAAPVLVLVGAVAFRRAGGPKGRALGRIAIGLGLVLLALIQLVATLEPFTSAPGLQAVLRAVSADAVIALLLGAILAWAAHSSVAVVLLVAAVAQQGIVPVETALALVLGANLGSSLNPLLASREAAGRRVALGNLLVRLVGCAAALPILSWSAASLTPVAGASRDAVADFHVLFNLALAAVGLPLLRPLSVVVVQLLPDRTAAPTEPPLHLDEGLAEPPSIALGLAARHALRMADRLEVMLTDSTRLLSGEEGSQERIRLAERDIDTRGAEIQRFLAKLDPEALSGAEQRRLATLVSFTVQIGHAADVLARNVAAQISRRHKQAGRPQPRADGDLTTMLDRLSTNLRTAASLLVTEDEVLARRLADEKQGFRSLEEMRIASHVASLRNVASFEPLNRVADLDLVRDIKRINDHLVASSAYPILMKRGELLESRLKYAD